MNSGTIETATPVERALTGVRSAMVELITVIHEGGLDHHDPGGKLRVLDGVQELGSMLAAVDAEVLADCRDGGVPERACARSMAQVLEHRCRVSPHEAGRRMRAADAVGSRRTATGLPVPPLRPQLAEALTSGEATAAQAAIVCHALDDLDKAGVDRVQVEQIEAELVEHARQFGPRELERICQRYRDVYDPDGVEPNEQRNRDRRSLEWWTTSSGAVAGKFRLTPETGAKLKAVLDALANPRVDTAGGASTPDLRTREQRRHDALDEALSRLLRSGGLPMSGGTPATVIVTIDLIDLLAHTGRLHGLDWQTWMNNAGFSAPDPARTGDDQESESQEVEGPTVVVESSDSITITDAGPPGRVRRSRPRYGITSDGTPLSVPELLRLAGEAEIYPVVLTQHGILLDLGRSRRIANQCQTMALIARDGGCSFPSCDHPPEYCERHHVISWLENGKTDVKNLTLVCPYHHHNLLDHGWQVKINTDGLPEWIPPRYLDPDQKPMINNRILARIHQASLLN